MKLLIITGRLTADAIWRNTPTNKFLSLTVSVYNGKNKDGSMKDSTIFNCTIYEKYGLLFAEKLVKNSRVFIQGDINSKIYQAKDGTYKSALNVSVDKIEILTNSDDSNGGMSYAANSKVEKGFVEDVESIPF